MDNKGSNKKPIFRAFRLERDIDADMVSIMGDHGESFSDFVRRAIKNLIRQENGIKHGRT